MSPDGSTSSPAVTHEVQSPGLSCQPLTPSAAASPTWHLNYKLPTFPLQLEVKLKNGQSLKEPERSALLEAIYESVKVFT